MMGLKLWARSSIFWLRIICGTEYEVRGLENIPKNGVLIAGKHQSSFETFALIPYLADPAMVLKRELTFIPWFGWFALKFGMIGIDRSAGPSAIKSLIKKAKLAISQNREVVIFPEGTRQALGAKPDYKPGAAALYLALNVPCVPFALNSGLYWPRRKFIRKPGKIIVSFLPAIPPGLKRREFEARLIHEVERASAELLA